jgi:PLD-like domain
MRGWRILLLDERDHEKGQGVLSLLAVGFPRDPREWMCDLAERLWLETFDMQDVEDDTGRKFVDLLLRKQAEGVQVNLIYDSVGSYATPASFFQRLRDGGIQVVEFNPVNPIKARGTWRLAKSDHRKMLIVDGKVAITGGVKITVEGRGQCPGGGLGQYPGRGQPDHVHQDQGVVFTSSCPLVVASH